MRIDRHEEVLFDFVEVFENLNHFQVVLPLVQFHLTELLIISMLIHQLLLSILQTLELTVVNIPEHHKPLFRQLLKRSQTCCSAVLVHYVFAETIVPRLQLVPYYLVHLETTLYVPVSVQSTSLIVHNDVVLRVDISVAQVNSVVHATLDDVLFELAPTACQYH